MRGRYDRRSRSVGATVPTRLAAFGLFALGLSGCLAANTSGRGPTPAIEARGSAEAEDAALFQVIDRALASVELESFEPLERDVPFTEIAFDAIEGWAEDDHGAALESFRRSCRKLGSLKKTTILGSFAGRIEDWKPSCEAAETVSPGAARAFFELAFTPIRLRSETGSKVTSYYEPVIEARRRPEGAFRHPIHARPAELVFADGAYGVKRAGGVRPFATRGEIQNGALRGRGLEIAYLADPVEAFYLHIQGSGQLRFKDGQTLRVGFAARNGHPYRSAAQEMIRRGLATGATASQARLSAYVAANPKKGMEILAANPSYIFFRRLEDLDPEVGPVGALGVQLTAGRSIAVDRRYTPLAAPVWLETESPEGPLKKLVIAQDTGSAIKGAQRADYFWGTGALAGERAGKVNHPGVLTVLLPTATVKRMTAELS